MPPRRASPRFMIREPNTASARALHERLDDGREHLGRVLAVAVEQHDDVAAVLDGPPVAPLLVAAVAEVLRVADDRERQVGRDLLVAERHEVGGVLAVVVADQDLVDRRCGSPTGIRSSTWARVVAAL